MKTEWDYTALADAYLKRPDYAPQAIDALLAKTQCGRGAKLCDVGAGTAHLALMLAKRGLLVTAIEPNDAMRAHGISRTKDFSNVSWFEGTGEHTGQGGGAFDLVTFGSSFNVTDRRAALIETARILKPGGWFACMWNHRQLDNPIQAEIEAIIAARVADYAYGTRREDQTQIIQASGLFETVEYIEGTVSHAQSIEDCIEAWRSHGTLQRQAGGRFEETVAAIAAFLKSLNRRTIDIPYVTRIWAAKKR